jgi:hypothetical protein
MEAKLVRSHKSDNEIWSIELAAQNKEEEYVIRRMSDRILIPSCLSSGPNKYPKLNLAFIEKDRCIEVKLSPIELKDDKYKIKCTR